MNPADYGMLWMGQFGQDRMILDDNSMLSVGMSVMDDIGHHAHSMDMNPLMGNVSEYTAVTAPGPIAITPDIIYPISTQQHFDQQQQTMLNHYSLDEEDDSNSMQHYDEDIENDGNQYGTFDSDPENSIANEMIEKAITVNRTNKKIKPVKRPGLVLKTPIAYQPCLDPSVIPIQRDGMAVCERCGAIGVKHSFYTKERRYCSMACARSGLENANHTNQTNDYNDGDVELELSTNQVQNQSYRFKMIPSVNDTIEGVMYKDIIPQDDLPQIVKGNRLPSPCPQDDKILSVRRKASEFYNSYDWNAKLSNPNFFAAPVTCFKHAPGYDMWSNIAIGIKVEVENTDCDNQGIQGFVPHSFWVASVLRICGYKALMRYEGFDVVSSHDFWVNLCSSEVHPVGWCATRGKPLIPPKSIEKKYSDWKDFLVNRLSGARTLPSTFYNKISDSFKSRFRVGLQLEVVDKNRISQVRLATVQKIVGKRLFVKYYDAPPEDNGFWCHEDSPLIHPVGWATTVGHNLAAPQEYVDRMQADPDQMIEPHEDDAGIELFKTNFTFEEYYLEEKSSHFTVRMKLEAVDPLNLSSICVATVMAVLKFGYIMIRIDSYDPDATGADWFCYHERSPCIFPAGFCYENSIDLTPPRGYENGFSWDIYLKDTNSVAAGTHLFCREIPSHGFSIGMKLECADLMDPRLVCVATIAKVVGRLLKVHFDGWEEEYDQWLDCESPDMYPVGWCILVGHKLEGPRILPKSQTQPKISVKSNRRKRKKKFKTDNGSLFVTDESEHCLISAKTTNQQSTRNTTIKKENLTTHHRQTNNSISAQIDELTDTKAKIIELEEYDTAPTESIEKPLKTTTNECKTMANLDMKKSHIATGCASALTQSAPPQERKATSYINNSISSSKLIPRLTDSPEINSSELDPETWNIYDVAQFLRVNDCTMHCDTFSRNKVDGKKMMQLTKDEIVTMLGMKVGPSLKIFDLIQQLKCKVNPQQSRHLKSKINSKKFL